MADDVSEAWNFFISAEQVRAIKALGREINGAHVSADIEPPGLELTITITSWSGPSAEIVCGGARTCLGDVTLIRTRP